ncbi:MAG: glycosyltransferase WbuB [Colwellia sp. Phe_37]|nr:MAG: glycosyltransferase WbuB [Colwellia sp. Phe_37]
MHLAFIIDDYLPESTRVGSKMLHELALDFIAKGHEVTVITPSVNFQPKKLDVIQLDGVNIWRFANGPVKDVGKVKRAINETLMSFNAWRAISSSVTKNTFDGVVYYSPSVFFGPLVRKIKKKCECKSYLILRDLFPQWAIDAGIIKEKSLITRYFRYFEHLSYKSADAIGLMSEKNHELFQSIHPELNNTHVLYNWAAVVPLGTVAELDSIRTLLNLKNKVIFFYGGNIGHAQDMKNLIKLAKGLKDEAEAHFLFIGQGDEVELITLLKNEWNLDNVTILPSITQAEFKKVLAEVDVGLFSLAKHHTAHNFPGKLLGYMVESIPILGSVNPGNDLMTIINKADAGKVFINGEDEDLLAHSIELLKNKSLRTRQGDGALKLLKTKFSVDAASSKILENLM